MNFDEMVQTTETAAPARRGLELRRAATITVAGLPTVSLMPRELRTAARERSIRRGLIGGVILALILAGGATAGSAGLTSSAQAQLDSANSDSQALVGQLSKFRDVQLLQRDLAVGNAAVKVGTSTEVDWQAQIDAIEANMPANYRVATILADSVTPIAVFPQGTTPLEMPRVATVLMTVDAPSITQLPIWLRKLRGIPAYADATATVASDDTGGYAVQLTIHLSQKAVVDVKKVSR